MYELINISPFTKKLKSIYLLAKSYNKLFKKFLKWKKNPV